MALVGYTPVAPLTSNLGVYPMISNPVINNLHAVNSIRPVSTGFQGISSATHPSINGQMTPRYVPMMSNSEVNPSVNHTVQNPPSANPMTTNAWTNSEMRAVMNPDVNPVLTGSQGISSATNPSINGHMTPRDVPMNSEVNPSVNHTVQNRPAVNPVTPNALTNSEMRAVMNPNVNPALTGSQGISSATSMNHQMTPRDVPMMSNSEVNPSFNHAVQNRPAANPVTPNALTNSEMRAVMNPNVNPDQTARSHIPSTDSSFLESLARELSCAICLDHLREPKLLPCLHRYCTHCLEPLIQANNIGTITCPMCKCEIDIPENGVDGLKTDFQLKNVVELIQARKSFETNSERRPEITRCRTHVTEHATLCCASCGNLPVCVTCTYGKHRDHNLHDVVELAQRERELLQIKIAELKNLEPKLLQLPNDIEQAKERLLENISRKTETLVQQYSQQVQKINQKIEKLNPIRMQGLSDIDHRRRGEQSQATLNYEEELKKLNEKYGEIRGSIDSKYNNETQQFDEGLSKVEYDLTCKLQSLESHFKNLTSCKDLLTQDKKTELDKLSKDCEQIINKYRSFTANASSIFAANNNWKDVQCLPSIRAGSKPLIEEMRKEYPQLESLSHIAVKDMPRLVANGVTFSDNEGSCVYVERFLNNGWRIDGMTSSEDGNIVITGCASNGYSHITVINRRGQIQKQNLIKREKQYNGTLIRRCCYLSDFKVATVYQPDEIGIYDVRNGHFHRKYMSNIFSWSDDIYVLCVTTDPVSRRILVGTNSRYVLVFDDKLNYSHTISLPDVINESYDIIVHEGTLVVCDNRGRKAYTVTMQASGSRIICELPKPSYTGAYNVEPENVRNDNNGFIYMLWHGGTSGQEEKGTLAQYSADGRQLLRTMNIDNSSFCLVAVDNGVYDLPSGEKQVHDALLIATYSLGKLYQYNLTRY